MAMDANTTVAARPGDQRRGPAAALHWLSDTLVVVGPDEDGAIAAVASRLPPEPGVVTVVAELVGPDDWDVLTEVLPIAVPPGSATRLCVSGVASPAASGRAPAAVLASVLQADVLAPAGRLLLVPGGALFAVDGWRRYDGQGLIARTGRRAPRPAWEAAVDGAAGRAGRGLVATPIPAGVWVHRADPGARLDELPYSVPVDPRRPLLVLGRPGTPAPDPGEVDRLVAALPASTLVAPYGTTGHAGAVLVARLVRQWQALVEVATGLPTLDASGKLVHTSVDPDGCGAWHPPHTRLRAGFTGPWQPVGPVDCLADLPTWARGYRLDEHWLVEPVQSGLWVRPLRAGPRAAEVRELAWDPTGLVIQVGLPGATRTDDALSALQALFARLPRPTAGRVEVRPAGRGVAGPGDGVDRRPARPELRPTGRTFHDGGVPAEVRPDRSAGRVLDRASGDDATQPARLSDVRHPRPGQKSYVDFTPERVGPPGWWRPHPRLFTVLVPATGPNDLVRIEAGVVDAGRLGELVASAAGWGGRPILLAASGPVSRAVPQRVADQVQAAVVADDGNGWCGVLPRRVRTVVAPELRLSSGFPFGADDLGRLARTPRRPLAVLGNPDGDAPLELRADPHVAGGLGDGGTVAVLAIDAGPAPGCPFQLAGEPVDGWRLATEIARRRPAWTHRDRAVRLVVDRVDRTAQQLLANYLGSPVEVRADRLTDPPSGVDGSRWCLARPRRPADPAGGRTEVS
jgi:hypothetical protein